MLRGKITYRLLASLLAALSVCTTLSAQSTRVRGRVTDAASGAPMQFVSVVFPGTTTGITTDEEGIYTLETRDTVGRVQASMVGYATQTKPLTRGGFNQVDFALEAVEFGIGSVVITPGENPAHPILKGVVRRKPQNDPDEYERYHCATYTKMELDLTNIKPRFRNKRLQRNFGFIFEYVDTSALTGQAYLPAMISETTADFYHSKRNPSLSREIIRANRVSAEFSVTTADSSKLTSFIGTREVVYTDVRIGEPIPAEVIRMDNNVVIGDQGPESSKDEAFWESVRPYRLSDKEKGIYSMVDSVQNVPLYRNIYTLINTVIVGYWNTKYIGIGPYYKLASFNKLEGFRMQPGFRTTTAVSRRIRLSGYAAYGTRDGMFKGGGSVELAFNRRLTRKLTVSGRHDVMQLGAGQNALTESNILSSLLSRGDSRLSMVNRGEAVYEHEWRHGISNFLGARIQKIYGNRYVPLVRPDGTVMNSVADAAVHVGMRISKNESIYRMPFDKQYMGTKYPVLTLGFTAGIPRVLSGSYEYYRLEGGIHYKPELPPLGYSDITVQGGKIFGKVPYPLLKLHEGNGTYFYDPMAFSCMNFYEFASDTWVALFFEHHFNGILLGRIPLIKKLKWREVLVCKGVWGTLSKENDGSLAATQAPLLFPPGMTSVSDPYVEVGFGVENIFRLLRVDFIWRVTHRDPKPGQEIQNFAVNLGIKLKF